jgi:hypothetical protein
MATVRPKTKYVVVSTSLETFEVGLLQKKGGE